MGGSRRLQGLCVRAGIDWGLSEVGPSKEFPRGDSSVRLKCVRVCVFLQRWRRFDFVKGIIGVVWGVRGVKASTCKVNSRQPGILFSLASEHSPVFFILFVSSLNATVIWLWFLNSRVSFWFRRYGKMKRRKGKYSVCFTWYLLSPSPVLPAGIPQVMDDSQCWAVCETVQRLQQFVWYSHIHWPKSCIYTQITGKKLQKITTV